jgi:urease accessory protein
VSLDDGVKAGLFLPRGTVLYNGEMLASDDGVIIEIKAAPEVVSTAHSDDPNILARACYHLGNRHVPLQIESAFLRYQHDHVLDDMVRGLGLTISHEEAPFEPERGAYGDYGHAGRHEHVHTSRQTNRHG